MYMKINQDIMPDLSDVKKEKKTKPKPKPKNKPKKNIVK